LKIVIGIDLGSTTTKAVVMDEQGRLRGRGITNTRSNYDVACEVARTEALIAGRFSVFRDRLEGRLKDWDGDAASLLNGVERSFRLVQYLGQLGVLRREIQDVTDGGAWHSFGSALCERAGVLLDRIEQEAPATFESQSKASAFFRDLAGSRYRELAEDPELQEDIGFDYLMSCFDKAIVKVENQPLDLSFETNASPAVDRFLAGASLPDAVSAGVREAVQEATAMEFEEAARVGTGYGRQKLPFEKHEIRSEILCHGLGAHWMFPDTRTVLDIGGQDTKAIQVNDTGVVTSFQMNDRCAAGCGRYLGYIADEMNLAVQDLGPLATKSRRKVKINSTCTVFAGAELRDRLAMGQKREDVVAGLHRAIILRAMSLLARSGGIEDEFTFTGGVANNIAAVESLKSLVHENYGERTVNISADSIYTGACGGALFALRELNDESPKAEEAA